jgi:glycosyltransferase involved in cell wall biosynthesis
MRYAIDAHALGRHLTGNEVYVRNLLEQLAPLEVEGKFIAYTSVPGAERMLPAGVEQRYVSDNPFKRLGLDLARRVRLDKPSLLHVQYTAPLACGAPVVASVHDVSYLERPEFFKGWRRTQLRLTVERTVRHAAKILTLSEFSRKGIAEAYQLDAGRIAVAPAACSEIFRPVPRAEAKAFVDGRFAVREPFILTVGDLQPRKNPIGLIRAFEELVARNSELPHHLVFAGKDTWFAPKVHQIAENSPFGNRIHFTGWVEDADLVQLYNACELFVFPSFYEGFGIPVLEAMACGRAVACSNTSALPEVAGGAAALFTVLQEVLTDEGRRERLERYGLQNAARYSWARTARLTLEIYAEVATRYSKSAPALAEQGHG